MNLRFFLPRAGVLAAAAFVIINSPAPARAAAAGRVREDFDANWLFSRGEFATAMMPAFDDHAWQRVNVPHVWSSDGPFSPKWASGTGYAPGGIGWYRKHFRLEADEKGRTVAIEFDGVYDNSEVWINGQFVGGRPYGFSSFQLALTPYIKFGGGDNVIAVRVDHSRYADSRYYTGSGIYRNVRLVIADQLHVAHWGVAITTPHVSASRTTVQMATTVTNESSSSREFVLWTEVVAPDGKIVATEEANARLDGAADREVRQELAVPNPQLWSLNDPKLYRAVSQIRSGGVVIDEVTSTFGIRTIHFDPDKGFFLNGKNLKIKGVCLHDDGGPVGAAVPEQVLARRLRRLKEIGANAIRTAHNPPDPVLLDLCDQMGFLVMDEAFDEFTPGKNKWVRGWNNGAPSHFGYNEIFNQWSVTDIRDLVRRDRNHPSVILWSIGNEVDYANDPFSDPVLGSRYRPENPPATDLISCAKPLVAAVKSLDYTRPVTAALATVKMSNAVGLPELLDAVGYNYQESRYAADHQKFPNRIIYGSENHHSYAAWLAVKTNAFISGQFLWTGADYLGEAGRWPSRGSGAGLLDLCSFKKPLAWFRQSLWSDKPMAYLCASRAGYGRFGGRFGFGARESWNWPANATVSVQCYANCPEVELSLNGRVIGTKRPSEAVNAVLRWRVPFEPGTLTAVGRDANGRELCQYALQTAGSASRIELLPDSTRLRADGKGVCQVEFRIVDEKGVRVPDAAPEVTFELAGPIRLLGIGNGNVSSDEDCKSNTHHAFQGWGLAILQTTTTAGEITLKAAAPGLEPASVTLRSL